MLWGGRDPRIERAMSAVKREFFVPDAQRRHAAEDAALPIGCEQTISQPSLVAHMTENLALTPHSRVLEIGTGSGYQTAILAELASEVFTIERIPELADEAHARLAKLGYRNIQFRIGDGALGWPEDAPYDAIIVTAAAPVLPPALLEQLKRGGRMVVPVGSVDDDNQMLMLCEKDRDDRVTQRELCAVRFVPLISDSAGS
jgi:protein-L-isoaspartate(D-aspartate) O-methyltransferase